MTWRNHITGEESRKWHLITESAFLSFASATWGMHSAVPAALTWGCLPSSLGRRFSCKRTSCTMPNKDMSYQGLCCFSVTLRFFLQSSCSQTHALQTILHVGRDTAGPGTAVSSPLVTSLGLPDPLVTGHVLDLM